MTASVAREVREHPLTAASFAVALAGLALGIAFGEWALGAIWAVSFVVIPLAFEERLRKGGYLLVLGAAMIAYGVIHVADHRSSWNAAIYVGCGATCFVAWEVDRRRQAQRISRGRG